MKKRILAAVMAAAMLTLGMAGCGSANNSNSENNETATTAASAEKTKVTFVLDWTPNTNHTGLYVAQEKGYFDEAGLEVEIVQPPEDGAEALVGTGKAQFCMTFQDTMLPTVVGDTKMPIEAVAAVLQHNTSGIISRKGEGIDTPKGLEGKKYATWDLPIEKATLKQVIEDDGGDFDKVELIPSTVTDEASALQSKSVDAIWVYYGWAGIATKLKNVDTDYFYFKDINPVFDYYTPVIAGNTDWMSENPDKTKAFLTALKKGYEYSIENIDDAADILVKAAPELDKELVLESQKYMADQYKAEVEQWGYIDAARWNAFYNWINEKKLLEVEIPENTGFTNEYLEK
ncbi:MAG: ABC transporter substrate-binding protein [Ruminococcus sp.]|uniref:ABC transporter substrate-binding protein n=1 Tax=Ruminococcus sp. JE7B6 TaxID=3233380 RepID=UPI00292F80B1|nr:ABC transporter substrate-binding protein [uncultured Ruminococcus sp.]MBQ1594045.1 ABC transporter substrate-binding protein [Ruminococcus sp.]MBQ2442872.1 ABC transporter substrate-binding protein [Ruminococcus sp.]MBQ4171674.1 ABC transporter substrate-binding protein [Ruminococcus sp.]MBQ4250296.1 ABC transporter substrate-binding protein [Ruminococcus sp.]MBQ5763394.1 ABC transporter substrate-binding protein [Ruminococcus sp.]